MDKVQYFKEAKYGLMIHFGLYSMLAGEYKGKIGPSYAEWIQSYLQIPNFEMERLASVFNPLYFDAEEIAVFAARCGMKYIVLTAKHHEGFALFKSFVDKYNIVDSTPFKRDIVKELSDACKKHGLKFGFYYSQCLDWHEKHGGGYLTDPKGAAGPTWENSWDFPDKTKKNYSLTFKTKILPQIEELLTNYGEIFIAWFDTPMGLSLEESKIIYNLVKRIQPDCLVNSRLGNGKYDYVALGDNEIPASIPERINYDTDKNSMRGFKHSPYNLYESACTLNNSWGYSVHDRNWKSPETILNNRLKLERLGINYLINIGPDWLGRIPAKSQEILVKVQELYKNNMVCSF